VSKKLMIWSVVLGIVLALLGLLEVSGESVWPTSAGAALFTESVEPELPLEAATDATLTH
jgi:hypothetical protein